MQHLLTVSLMAAIGLASLAGAAPGKVLFDFEGAFDASEVEARNVEVSVAESETGAALRLESGHKTA